MSQQGLSVGIYTLGCKVNQYESEAIAELFAAEGFSLRAPTEPCDIYVINTCTVTAESDRKACQFIRRAIHKNPNAYVLVTGCLSQTQPARVAAIEGVDYICGNADKTSVVAAAKELIAGGKKRNCAAVSVVAPDALGFEKMNITRFDRTRAYIKIEDGCENKCAYCIIPKARGKIRSKTPADVLDEVRTLTENGCQEIVLTGIETASYGKDLNGYTLADLLSEIDEIEQVGRIRLGSLDPSLMKQAFVDRIAKLNSLAPHFHLSMQSGSDRTLARMRRKYNTQMALDGMRRLREAIPNVQFTTDMIVGFPGESEENFAETLDFIRQAEFLMIHVFPYSRRAGTEADRMDGQIPETVKHARVKRLSEEQAKIRAKILTRQIGARADVLFETIRAGTAYGHTPNFIEVVCPASHICQAQTHAVEITDADGEHCYGRLIKIQEKG
ncbi:MAG: tRNA (N(6)-L-threonylcarbamoyladenosine(37)-C(2))-methylthiotransferase MtaB [Clostridia bacterium]|nr:tRNA (N(6)-L-threonylcarbamoyladenosine(37)-C(2))-methylthiotransferase MtaB [Clostridia bacterium]